MFSTSPVPFVWSHNFAPAPHVQLLKSTYWALLKKRKRRDHHFIFLLPSRFFFGGATEGNEEGRSGEDMQCTRCFRLILPVTRTSIPIYLYYESLFKPRQLGLSTSPEFLLHARSRIKVSRVSLACLFLTEPVCRRSLQILRYGIQLSRLERHLLYPSI